MDLILMLFVGIAIGFSSCILILSYKKNKILKKYNDDIENMFSVILYTFERLTFVKRINKYAYFTYDLWEIIYQLDNRTIHIFNKEECLATSKNINTSKGLKIIEDILTSIDKTWGKEINNTIIIDSNELSVNYVESQIKKAQMDPILAKIEKDSKIIHLTIDDVLDKINKVGYTNLTNEEKDFLKNASK